MDDDQRIQWITRLNADLERVRSVDNRVLARVGIGLAALATLASLAFHELVARLNDGTLELANSVLMAILVYFSFGGIIQLWHLVRRDETSSYGLPLVESPYGLSAQFGIETPRTYHRAIRIALGALAVHMITGSTDTRLAIAILAIEAIAWLGSDLPVHMEIRRLRRGERRVSEDKPLDLVIEVVGIAVPVAYLVLTGAVTWARYDMTTAFFGQAWFVALGVGCLAVGKFVAQHIKEYDTRMQRGIGRLRFLIASGDIEAADAAPAYLHIYQTGRISRTLERKGLDLAVERGLKRQQQEAQSDSSPGRTEDSPQPTSSES